MDTIEKQGLAARTRERNALTWLSLDFGGVMAPLGFMEADLDSIAKPSIENYLVTSDEAWGIKEYQRDKTIELSQAEVDQDRVIAEAKAATGRAKIAIEMAADEYVLAAKIYDSKVKALVMGAKEYAARVELEQLAVEEAKSGLAIDKEALRRTKVRTDTYLQTIEQAMVEADIAKAQVEVAKAHVRAAMAEIEVKRAEIQLIEAETEKFVAAAQKAELRADVAMIWAEIMTKQLSTVKLDVGRKEIEAGFRHIQTRLDDALAILGIKLAAEEDLLAVQNILLSEVPLGLAVDKVHEDLRERAVDDARDVFEQERSLTANNLSAERGMRAGLVEARNDLSDTRRQVAMDTDEKKTWAVLLLNAAERWFHKNRVSLTASTEKSSRDWTIRKG